MEVDLEHPREMNLLGLFMKAALEERATRLERTNIDGDIAISVGAMAVTLCFSPGRVVVRRGLVGEPAAHIKGSLEALVAIAAGDIVKPLLTRRARVSGDVRAALPLARLFWQTARDRPT